MAFRDEPPWFCSATNNLNAHRQRSNILEAPLPPSPQQHTSHAHCSALLFSQARARAGERHNMAGMMDPNMRGSLESSMRPYMRMQNLFVREIDTSLSRDVVISELSNYCSPAQGKVVVPVHDTSGGILGIAYLNYLSTGEGEQRTAA